MVIVTSNSMSKAQEFKQEVQVNYVSVQDAE